MDYIRYMSEGREKFPCVTPWYFSKELDSDWRRKITVEVRAECDLEFGMAFSAKAVRSIGSSEEKFHVVGNKPIFLYFPSKKVMSAVSYRVHRVFAQRNGARRMAGLLALESGFRRTIVRSPAGAKARFAVQRRGVFSGNGLLTWAIEV
jgi:hypothetical protein